MLKTCLVGLGIELVGNNLRHSPAWISEFGEALFPSKRTTGVFLAGVGQSVQYFSLMAPAAAYISASFSSISTASVEERFVSYLGLSALSLGCALVLLQPIITNIFLANADNCYEAAKEHGRHYNAYRLNNLKCILETIETFSTGTIKTLCIGSLFFNQPLSVTVGAGTIMSISLLSK